MNNTDIHDPVFGKAVGAIDNGDVEALKQLIAAHPRLLEQRLELPEAGYFRDPYLLWFVAGNPVRKEKLANNLVEVASFLIHQLKAANAASAQFQLDYTAALAATGSVVRDCGLQIPLLRILLEEGARVPGLVGALAHGNKEAAEFLLASGAELTLTSAVCLDKTGALDKLFDEADEKEKLLAVAAAAFYGTASMLQYLIDRGAPVNGYPDPSTGFHSHATALHQAVSSGSLACVNMLVNGGADTRAADKRFRATAIEWSRYLQQEEKDPLRKADYKRIQDYLENLE